MGGVMSCIEQTGDCFRFDGSDWHRSLSLPVKATYSRLTVVRIEGTDSILFTGGGYSANFKSETHDNKPSSYAWQEPQIMVEYRVCHCTVHDKSTGEIYSFGGVNQMGTLLESIESYQDEQWITTPFKLRTTRCGAAGLLSAGMLYIFGGFSTDE